MPGYVDPFGLGGALTIGMAGLSFTLDVKNKEVLTKLTSEIQKFGTTVGNTFNKMNEGLEKATTATGLAMQTLSGAVTGMVIPATMLAARNQVLDTTMRAVGNSAGKGAEALRNVADAIKKQGITTEDANNATIRFTQSQLNLSKASQLARVSQDLAVVTGENSSQVFTKLTDAIASYNTMTLNQYGLLKNMNDILKDYATEQKKTVEALTEREAKEAMLNYILKEGIKVQNAYKYAMADAGKIMSSIERLKTEAMASFGEQFLKPFSSYISTVYQALSALDKLDKGQKKTLSGMVVWGAIFAEVGSRVIEFTKANGGLIGTLLTLGKKVLDVSFALWTLKMGLEVFDLLAKGQIATRLTGMATSLGEMSVNLAAAGTRWGGFGATIANVGVTALNSIKGMATGAAAMTANITMMGTKGEFLTSIARSWAASSSAAALGTNAMATAMSNGTKKVLGLAWAFTGIKEAAQFASVALLDMAKAGFVVATAAINNTILTTMRWLGLNQLFTASIVSQTVAKEVQLAVIAQEAAILETVMTEENVLYEAEIALKSELAMIDEMKITQTEKDILISKAKIAVMAEENAMFASRRTAVEADIAIESVRSKERAAALIAEKMAAALSVVYFTVAAGAAVLAYTQIKKYYDQAQEAKKQAEEANKIIEEKASAAEAYSAIYEGLESKSKSYLMVAKGETEAQREQISLYGNLKDASEACTDGIHKYIDAKIVQAKRENEANAFLKTSAELTQGQAMSTENRVRQEKFINDALSERLMRMERLAQINKDMAKAGEKDLLGIGTASDWDQATMGHMRQVWNTQDKKSGGGFTGASLKGGLLAVLRQLGIASLGPIGMGIDQYTSPKGEEQQAARDEASKQLETDLRNMREKAKILTEEPQIVEQITQAYHIRFKDQAEQTKGIAEAAGNLNALRDRTQASLLEEQAKGWGKSEASIKNYKQRLQDIMIAQEALRKGVKLWGDTVVDTINKAAEKFRTFDMREQFMGLRPGQSPEEQMDELKGINKARYDEIQKVMLALTQKHKSISEAAAKDELNTVEKQIEMLKYFLGTTDKAIAETILATYPKILASMDEQFQAALQKDREAVQAFQAQKGEMEQANISRMQELEDSQNNFYLGTLQQRIDGINRLGAAQEAYFYKYTKGFQQQQELERLGIESQKRRIDVVIDHYKNVLERQKTAMSDFANNTNNAITGSRSASGLNKSQIDESFKNTADVIKTRVAPAYEQLAMVIQGTMAQSRANSKELEAANSKFADAKRLKEEYAKVAAPGKDPSAIYGKAASLKPGTPGYNQAIDSLYSESIQKERKNQDKLSDEITKAVKEREDMVDRISQSANVRRNAAIEDRTRQMIQQKKDDLKVWGRYSLTGEEEQAIKRKATEDILDEEKKATGYQKVKAAERDADLKSLKQKKEYIDLKKKELAESQGVEEKLKKEADGFINAAASQEQYVTVSKQLDAVKKKGILTEKEAAQIMSSGSKDIWGAIDKAQEIMEKQGKYTGAVKEEWENLKAGLEASGESRWGLDKNGAEMKKLYEAQKETAFDAISAEISYRDKAIEVQKQKMAGYSSANKLEAQKRINEWQKENEQAEKQLADMRKGLYQEFDSFRESMDQESYSRQQGIMRKMLTSTLTGTALAEALRDAQAASLKIQMESIVTSINKAKLDIADSATTTIKRNIERAYNEIGNLDMRNRMASTTGQEKAENDRKRNAELQRVLQGEQQLGSMRLNIYQEYIQRVTELNDNDFHATLKAYDIVMEKYKDNEDVMRKLIKDRYKVEEAGRKQQYDAWKSMTREMEEAKHGPVFGQVLDLQEQMKTYKKLFAGSSLSGKVDEYEKFKMQQLRASYEQQRQESTGAGDGGSISGFTNGGAGMMESFDSMVSDAKSVAQNMTNTKSSVLGIGDNTAKVDQVMREFVGDLANAGESMNLLNQAIERVIHTVNRMSQSRADVQRAGGTYEQYTGRQAQVTNNYNTLNMPAQVDYRVIKQGQDTIKTFVETGISNYQGATGGPVPTSSGMYQPQGGFLAPSMNISTSPTVQFSTDSAPQRLQESPTNFGGGNGGNRVPYDGPQMSTTGYDSSGKLQRSEGQQSAPHANVSTTTYDKTTGKMNG